MPISINQEVSFTDPNDVTVSGVVSGTKTIDEVDVSLDGLVVSTSALNEDATWNANISFADNGAESVGAQAKYGDGTTDASNSLLLFSNISLDHQYSTLLQVFGAEQFGTVYGGHGRGLYDISFVNGNQTQFDDVVGRGGASISYTDFLNAAETIDNFRVAGRHHDTLNLSDTSLHTLAQVLHHTTMSGGDATIHTGHGESVTLTGVTKAQIAANPHDLVFTGGHTLAPS